MRSGQIAALLAERGVGPGDGVVVMIPMSASLYAVLAALLRLGAVAVFVEPGQAEAQLSCARKALALKAFIGTPLACLLRVLKPGLRMIPLAFVTQRWFPGACSLHAARHLSPRLLAQSGMEDASALLTFTSGSTGTAKGLLRSHGLLRATQDALVANLALPPGSINLATMPALVMANIGQGVTSLIPP
jgi:acyl-CoA synthetase (AMP-forming)/AMP-acid ligase II